MKRYQDIRPGLRAAIVLSVLWLGAFGWPQIATARHHANDVAKASFARCVERNLRLRRDGDCHALRRRVFLNRTRGAELAALRMAVAVLVIAWSMGGACYVLYATGERE